MQVIASRMERNLKKMKKAREREKNRKAKMKMET